MKTRQRSRRRNAKLRRGTTPNTCTPTNGFQIIDNKELDRANQTVKKQQEQTSRNLEHII